MAKTWYPMINEELCTECGACTDKCSHGVYDKDQAPKPVVVYPDGCVDGCKGCGSLCPSEAISYYGDSIDQKDGCVCGCDGECDCK